MDNPWTKLKKDSPYILDIDQKWVNEYTVDLQKIADRKNDTDRNELLRVHSLRTDIAPLPYYGNPNNASVVVLQANPGYDERWKETSIANDLQDFDLSNLTHSVAIPLYTFQPHLREMRYANGDARECWYWQRTRALRERAGWENVSRKLMYLEHFPYRSIRLRYPKSLPPSQEYTFFLLRELMKNNVWVIISRMEKEWITHVPELATYPRVSRLRSKQNATLSPNNMTSRNFEEIIGMMKS